MTFDVDGDPAEAYDATVAEMGLGGEPPDGAVWHYAGPYDGGWRVIDLWEDEAKYEKFAEEQIGPIAGRHGITMRSVERIPVSEHGDNHDTASAGFVQIVRTGVPEERFRELDSKVRPDRQPPANLLHHINGPGADGTWVVVDSWTSRADRDAFMQSRVFPNADGMHPTVEDLEVHNTMTRAATPA